MFRIYVRHSILLQLPATFGFHINFKFRRISLHIYAYVYIWRVRNFIEYVAQVSLDVYYTFVFSLSADTFFAFTSGLNGN